MLLWLRKKLPFAGYSVVKDQPGDCVPPDPLARSLAGTPRSPLRCRGASPCSSAQTLASLLGRRSAKGAKVAVREPASLPLGRVSQSMFRLRPVSCPTSSRLHPTARCCRLGCLASVHLRQTLTPFAAPVDILRARSSWLAIRSCERSERLAKDGGEYRARTGDLLVANQALSQLS